MRKSYLRKRSKTKKVDRLSGLPDPILCYILAFLPTRSAVATSVLSQRWERMWPRIPVLDFTDIENDSITDGQQYRSLKHFLNRVLLHNSALCLERVDFDVLQVMREKDQQEWFKVLSRRSIKEVNLFHNQCCYLPLANLLRGTAGEHLVKLNIEWGYDYFEYINVTISSMLHFPMLEIVHLLGVNFTDHGEPIRSLVHGSPCLRELVLSSCSGGAIDFRCPTLKILKLLTCHVTTTDIEVPNLEHFELILDEEHFASNGALEDFQFVIDDMPCLSQAKIYKCRIRASTWAYLFRKVRHVTKLDVSLSHFLDVGEEEEEEEEEDEWNLTMDFSLPYFKRLICLELRCDEELRLLQTRLFLSHMPNCVSLIIRMTLCSSCAADLQKFSPTNNSSSVGLHVEYIEIHDIGRNRLASVELLRYLLDCFKGLKEVKLHLSGIRSGWKNMMQTTIMNLSRPSTCKIIIGD